MLYIHKKKFATLNSVLLHANNAMIIVILAKAWLKTPIYRLFTCFCYLPVFHQVNSSLNPFNCLSSLATLFRGKWINLGSLSLFPHRPLIKRQVLNDTIDEWHCLYQYPLRPTDWFRFQKSVPRKFTTWHSLNYT